MPSDYITLNALTYELNCALHGGKIRRICQPEKDEITISVYNGKSNLLLVISANPNSPRIHLTTVKKENPYAAPPLLMVLRKYIGSAVIKGVSCLAEDRIAEIALSARNEMFDDEDFYLVCELMGRYSNIILLDKERRILDSLYKLVPDEKQKRQIMKGARYLPPEQNKPFIGDKEAIEKGLITTPPDRYADFLVKQTAGVSLPAAKTILHIAKERDGCTPKAIAEIAAAFSDLPRSPYFYPCLKREDPQDFFPYRYPFASVEKQDSLNRCADEIYSLSDKLSRVRTKSRSLEHVVNAAIRKTKNSVAAISQKIAEGEKADELLRTAELITSNLYRIKPRDREVTVFDYARGQECTLPLDPILSPKDYAQKLFKRYRKLKRGREINASLLRQNQDDLLYYEGLAAQLKMADNLQDLSMTEEEMREEGLLRNEQKSKAKTPKIPCTLYEKDGCRIYCGKDGIRNEYVTFKLGKEGDLWFHIAKAHGAHVILSHPDPSEELILFAAEIAAYYSERRNDQSAEVDYTRRRNVRRHPAKKVGLVYYSDYKTIAVHPNEHEEYKK